MDINLKTNETPPQKKTEVKETIAAGMRVWGWQENGHKPKNHQEIKKLKTPPKNRDIKRPLQLDWGSGDGREMDINQKTNKKSIKNKNKKNPKKTQRGKETIMAGLMVWGRLGDDPFLKLLLVPGEHHLLDHPLVLLDLRLLVPQQFLLCREPVLKVVHCVAPVHPWLGAKSAPDLWDYFV